MVADCPFCHIASGDQHAHYLYRDERTMAFLDIDPAVRGHALVVPRAHVEGLVDMGDRTTSALFETVRVVAVAIDRALDPDGFSVFHTTGPLVGSVDHAHVHLLPRRADDSVQLGLKRKPLDDDEGERLAARIRAEL